MLNIRVLEEGEIPQATETLLSAFFEDDLVRYMFPEPEFRREFLRWAYSRWLALLLRFKSVFVDDDIRGVAGCIPPIFSRHIPIRYQIQSGLLRAIPMLGIRRIWRPARVYLDSQSRMRKEIRSPMWVLDILGVRRDCQGQGIGSALVQYLINRAKKDNCSAYVITHKEENVRFYEKNGFQLIKRENSLPGGPPTCSLIYTS